MKLLNANVITEDNNLLSKTMQLRNVIRKRRRIIEKQASPT